MADILLVEDIPMQTTLLRRYLRDHHSVVGTAETADEAVEIADEYSPDVVVMDLSLKRGDGISATAEITAANPSTAVIVSTVAVGDDARTQATDAGADEYLIKPYSKAELLAAIDRVLTTT
ncbi:response regulator [Halobellus captivus]|uniref:response regulator n=1 Tax=Halobellus captivus TaxID=2592614 RepID=UPI0011A41383|nr:response regulator [Halobellus captivus]